ncbi:MAG: dihydroorotate dehydrogenase electron transfer subunit [Clostridia bacterium]|nr:dihydroorotate dehydrogenase electron transfer subunit [Clostridia bacterium]
MSGLGAGSAGGAGVGPVVAPAAVAAVRRGGPGAWELVLAGVPALAAAEPGQFLHVLCGSVFLRRPFSIYRVSPDGAAVSVLFRVVGRGTAWLAERRPGDVLDVIGPLGRPFPLPVPAGEAPGTGPAAPAAGGATLLLVGGGVGVPPLAFLAARARAAGHRVRAAVGARTAETLLGVEALEAVGAAVAVATDDGSAGRRGTVVELAEDLLRDGLTPTVLYACGPMPMLRAVRGLALAAGLPAYLCLEEIMACGVGACLGCPVASASPSGPRYLRVCADGPVFEAREVSL